jgi:hypothetical protein
MHYFNEWDPERLIECGAPPDEYSGEIETILSLLYIYIVGTLSE